ncbi:MAG: 3-phosphoshikimate 1-carboxyvinyltransferase [Candidatus Brocadiia bacterium]
MKLIAEHSALGGTVRVPGSKSHTIRALLVGSLAEGHSEVYEPLDSLDTQACVAACRAMGATVRLGHDWLIEGTGAQLACPDDVVDVGNSGTTLYLALGAAALGQGWTVFTGDQQIRARSAEPLLEALRGLGAEAFSTRGNGCAPLVVRGPLRGGRVAIECPTSQYLSSLLLACPLAEGDTEIEVLKLHERPYVEMTLGWLESQGVRPEREGWERLRIPGGQSYRAFRRQIPGDFSTATFFLVAAAITGSEVTLMGLEKDDAQGDKAVVDMLAAMGAQVEWQEGGLRLRGAGLRGGEFDLNATPDALPAMAVAACLAEDASRLANVPQARIKETDRIRVMAEELGKMGAQVEELPDGLAIQGGALEGATVDGRGDHRVAMALAVAGLVASGRTEVQGAEAAAVTCPDFVPLMASLGARIREE